MPEAIPPGYKKTEIGIIPEEWEVKRLGEVAEIVGRIGFRGYTKKDIVKPWKGAISISPINILNYRLDFKTNLTFISWRKYEESPEIKVRKNNILFVKTGSTLGKSAFVTELPFPSTINPQLVIIRSNKQNNRFIAYFLETRFFNNSLNFILGGGAIPTLSQAHLSNIKIPLPPLPEQRAIARILSDIDELIESIDKLIEKKKRIKKGAMQELLSGKKRLPGFKGEWVRKRLGEVADITMGQSPDSKYYNLNRIGLPLIQGNADIEKGKTIARIFTSQITKISKKGDVILTVRAPVGEVAINSFDSCIGRGVCSISSQNNLFIFYLLYFMKNEWKTFSEGSTYDAINSDIVKNFKISLPPTLAEQKAIAQILSDMDAEIEGLERKKRKYEKIKKGMMDLLLTGKVRVKEENGEIKRIGGIDIEVLK